MLFVNYFWLKYDIVQFQWSKLTHGDMIIPSVKLNQSFDLARES